MAKQEAEKINFRYTLDAFTSLSHVLPIFYDENINVQPLKQLSVCREYFCFFFDTNDKQYKILMYYTNNRQETGYGVPIKKLQNYIHIVHNSSDIEQLKAGTGSPFLRENLTILSDMFEECSIKKFMRDITNIIKRLEKVKPELKGVKDLNQSIDSYSLKREVRYKSNYSVYNFEFPIHRVLIPAMDVFGKNTYRQKLQTTIVRVYDDLEVFGFDDVNFARTAKILYSQYKIYHKILDYVKRYVPTKFSNSWTTQNSLR